MRTVLLQFHVANAKVHPSILLGGLTFSGQQRFCQRKHNKQKKEKKPVTSVL